MIKINEIFFSIQGESSLAGWPTVFIRTSGCHLRCTYCDTKYAYYEGEQMPVEKIMQEVARHPCRHVCVTGGEPLLQSDVYLLMKELCDRGYTVSLETSGDISCKEVDPRVLKVIDIKTPDSGEPSRFARENLDLAKVNSEFKFVICSENDFTWAHNYCRENSLYNNTNVFFSPSHGQVEPQWLAEKILRHGSGARLQLQQHKYIWSPNTRGV